jgi:hypothetical protein
MHFSFFKKLFGMGDSNSVPAESVPIDRPVIDARVAECPYCKGALKKIPGAKTKCPRCGEFMYVRTSSTDNARKVVTKEQADKIAEDWAIVSGTHDQFVADKEQVRQERSRLRSRFGKEPSERDVQWGILNQNLLKHAHNGDWGLYRNERFSMGELLRKEQRLQQALCFYLEVCYLDLNGPNNTGGTTDPEILAEFPPFSPQEFAMLAPGVVDRIGVIIRRLSLDAAAVKTKYFDYCSRATKGLRLPRTPEECWPLIEQELHSV